MEIEGASAVTLFGRSDNERHAGGRFKPSTPTGAQRCTGAHADHPSDYPW
jgi:hypothetical protein